MNRAAVTTAILELGTGNYAWGPLVMVLAPSSSGMVGLLAVRYVVNGSAQPIAGFQVKPFF
jgi:hypothetical protein